MVNKKFEVIRERLCNGKALADQKSKDFCL